MEEDYFEFSALVALLGLILAVVGNYFPNLSKKLDIAIHKIGIFCLKESRGLFDISQNICRFYLAFGIGAIALTYILNLDWKEIFYYTIYSFYESENILDIIITTLEASHWFIAGLYFFSPLIMVAIFLNAYLIIALRKNANRSALSGIGLLMAAYSFLTIFVNETFTNYHSESALVVDAKVYLEKKGYGFIDDRLVHKDQVKIIRDVLNSAK